MKKLFIILAAIMLISITGISAYADDAPDAIDDLTATLSGNTVTLNWSQPSTHSDFVDVEVEQRTDGGNWRGACASVRSSETTCDSPVGNGFTYDYRVKIKNDIGWSAWSNVVQVYVPNLPNAIDDLTASLSGSTVTLNWSHPQSDASFVDVQVQQITDLPNDNWRDTCIPTLSSETTCDSSVGQGITYDYRVRIENTAGWSQWSNVVQIYSPNPPGTINDLTASLTGNTVTLNWSQPASDTAFVDIEHNQRSDGVTWRGACNSASSSDTTCNVGVADGFTYDFRVQIKNTVDWSAWSNIVQVYVPDTSSPSLNVQSPTEGSTINTDYVDVNGTAFDVESGIALVQISLDSQSLVQATGTSPWSYTFTGQSDGAHTVDVIVTNGDGLQTSSSTINFTITTADIIPPVITLIGDNPQTIDLGVGYNELGATTDDGSAIIVDYSSFLDLVGSYDIYYDSVDAAGNNATTVTRIVIVVGPTLYCGLPESSYNVIHGTEASEYIEGTPQADLIFGYGGNDFIRALGGNDCIYGGDGNDFIQGFHGDDIIYGGNGDDVVRTGPGNDIVYGEAGNDILHAVSAKGVNTLDGGDGDEDICIRPFDRVTMNTTNCEITN